MYKVVRELILFILISYLAIWVTIIILSNLDLRSSSPIVTQIEEIFLIQLSFIVWFLVLIFLYFVRILFFFLAEKFNSNP
jgi:hypothetical protein